MKTLSDVVDNEFVKNTKFNRLKTKIKKKIPDESTFIYINQYNTDKQSLGRKIGGADKKNTRY